MTIMLRLISHFLNLYLLMFALSIMMTNPCFADAFPLEDCRQKDIDLLLVADGNFLTPDQQLYLMNIFDYFRSPNEANLTRLKVAFAVANPTAGPVLHFSFDLHDYADDAKNAVWEMPNNGNRSRRNVSESSVQQTMDFVCSSVNDIPGGRHNVNHVAVVIVGTSWPETLEEIRGTHQTAGASCSIQIFLVLVGFDLTETIKLEIAQSKNQFYSEGVDRYLHPLPAKLCCRWSMSHYKTSSLRSCYLFVQNSRFQSWLEASSMCKMQGGQLSSFETEEELEFIDSVLGEMITEEAATSDTRYAVRHIYIGLTRDSSRIGSPFVWANGNPLLYTKWLYGNPYRGPNVRCGLWRLETQYNSLESTWQEVGCGYNDNNNALCEVVVENTNFQSDNAITVPPASTSRVEQAISRGEFTTFIEQIVSIPVYSAYYPNFLQEISLTFKVFECTGNNQDTKSIPYSFVCDHIRHCEDGRDETICQYRKCHPRNEFTCRSLQCVPLESRCDVYKDCYDGSDEEDCDFCRGFVCCDGSCVPTHFLLNGAIECNGCDPSENEERYRQLAKWENRKEPMDCPFICNRSQCVFPYMLDNNITECVGPEGPLDETIGKLKTSDSCVIEDHFKPYTRWSPQCVYLKDRYGSVIGCRNMLHLHNCQNFTCPESYVKCPNSYCIPLHLVGDGSKDCPMGEDERGLDINCLGNFACWGGKVCVHPDLVCDGQPHCPSGDDELNCNVTCIDGFQCLAGTVTVTHFDESQSLKTLSFIDNCTRYVDLSGIDLSTSFKDGDKGQFINLVELRLSNCNLKDVNGGFVADIRTLDTVSVLDLSHNSISRISANSMIRFMTNLHELDLSHNKLLKSLPIAGFYHNSFKSVLVTLNLASTGLSALNSTSFQGLSKLRYLNLSKTHINRVVRNTFPENFQLISLDIRGTPLSDIEPGALSGLTVSQELYTDLFKLCCPQVRGEGVDDQVCHAPVSAVSSCSDLIGEPFQRALLWIVGVLAILGNVLVIVYRLVYEAHVLKKSYGLFVTNLSVSDLFMGVYLLIIAGNDVVYRGDYVYHETYWRHSALCQTAGFLSTMSSETSAFFILLITIDRFLVMKFPYGKFSFSNKTMIVSCVVAWSVSIVLALIPVLPTFANWAMYSSNGMCLGLPLTTERHPGWEYSISIFIVLNFVLFLFIACGQLFIYRAVSENRLTTSETQKNSRRIQEIMVAKQLSLVALSDFLCWFPVGLMGLLAASGRDVGTEAYTWSAVLVLPINSAINPLLYTVPLIMKKWEHFKAGRTKSQNDTQTGSLRNAPAQ